jgi:SAM-dependent methyltransferase
MNFLNKLKSKIYFSLLNSQLLYEYENQKFINANERPVEFAYVFKKIQEIYPKSILDVGTGRTALPHLMQNCNIKTAAIDNITDYWKDEFHNRHFYIINDDITKTKLTEQFEMITCVSVLEHIIEFDSAVNSMVNLLKPGGHLILTFPYNEFSYIPNAYDLKGSTYGKNFSFKTQIYTREIINNWINIHNLELVEQEYWRFWTGNFWTVGEIILPPIKVNKEDNLQLTCICLKKKC